jgi:hypothetical protein
MSGSWSTEHLLLSFFGRGIAFRLRATVPVNYMVQSKLYELLIIIRLRNDLNKEFH